LIDKISGSSLKWPRTNQPCCY